MKKRNIANHSNSGKVKNLLSAVLAAIFAIGMTSCSKEDDNAIGNQVTDDNVVEDNPEALFQKAFVVFINRMAVGAIHEKGAFTLFLKHFFNERKAVTTLLQRGNRLLRRQSALVNKRQLRRCYTADNETLAGPFRDKAGTLSHGLKQG